MKAALAAAGVLAACDAAKQTSPTLRDRILGARTSQYCDSVCMNPHVLATERGYVVTSFTGPTAFYKVVATRDLREYLLSLPMTAWPRGAEILISPTDDVTDTTLLDRNFSEAQRICRALGLAVETRMGG